MHLNEYFYQDAQYPDASAVSYDEQNGRVSGHYTSKIGARSNRIATIENYDRRIEWPRKNV